MPSLSLAGGGLLRSRGAQRHSNPPLWTVTDTLLIVWQLISEVIGEHVYVPQGSNTRLTRCLCALFSSTFIDAKLRAAVHFDLAGERQPYAA